MTFPEVSEGLEGMMDDPDLAGLLGGAPQVSGEFTVAMDRWSDMHGDPDPYTCSDWVRMRPRPKFGVRVTAMEDWKPKPTNAKGKKLTNAYTAKVKGELIVDDRRYPIAFDARVQFREARRTEQESRPASMSIRGEFSFLGADFDLTGDDAGAIHASLVMVGYTNFATTTSGELKQALDQKVSWD